MPDQGVIKREIEISGRVFSLETGRVANQAHGAVLARYGDTVLTAPDALTSPRRPTALRCTTTDRPTRGEP